MQRILVIEDDIDIQDILKNHLADAGYEVVIAADGVAGIAKFDDIVTPVYKEKGEPLRDILLKLMLADIEPR